jgi:hypothetical protein
MLYTTLHYTTLHASLANQHFQTYQQRSPDDPINSSLQYTTRLNTNYLLLTTLLLARHDPKVAIGRVLLRRLNLRRSLLRNLAPATRSRISGTTALGRGGSVDEALVGKSLAADELLGEVARVDGAAAAVDGFGDELGFGGEEDEIGDELFGSKTGVEVGTKLVDGPLPELLLGVDGTG